MFVAAYKREREVKERRKMHSFSVNWKIVVSTWGMLCIYAYIYKWCCVLWRLPIKGSFLQFGAEVDDTKSTKVEDSLNEKSDKCLMDFCDVRNEE